MSLFSASPDYYNLVIQTAGESGYLSQGFSFGQTILILPIVAFSSLFAVGTVYVGGEVRNVGRTQLWGMILGLTGLAVINTLIYFLLVKVVGQEFLGAVNYLWFEETLPDLPLNPFFNLFILVLTSSPVLVILTGLGYFAMSVLFVPMNILLNTRMVFAWTFDRILPELFAKVHPRTHSPTNATILVMVIAEIFLVIFAFTPWLSTLGAIAGTLIAFFCTALAALLFPYRRRALFEASPIARYRIGTLPLISICGAIGVVYLVATQVGFLVNDKYLVNSPTGLGIIGGVIILGVVIYFLAQSVQRRRGIDLQMMSQEVPPE